MRVLAAGSLSPVSGHRAALLEEVVSLRREGHDVKVLSLNHAAGAHRYMAAPGIPAAIEVGLTGGRFDGVVVQIGPGLPVRAGAGRLERAAALVTLATMLRRLPDVTLRLDRPEDLPGGPGGRAGLLLWMTARRINVGPQVDADEFAALLPDGWERLTVASPGAPQPTVVSEFDWSDYGVTAARVNEVIRRRAAAVRQALAEALTPAYEGAAEPAPRVEQWEWLPSPGLGVPDFGRLRTRSGLAASSRSPRRLAEHALRVAEHHAATRSAARLARVALAELRAVARRR